MRGAYGAVQYYERKAVMFEVVTNAVRSIATDKKGAALVEYGLLVALIALCRYRGNYSSRHECGDIV